MNKEKSILERYIDFPDILNRNQAECFDYTKKQNKYLKIFLVLFVIKYLFLFFLSFKCLKQNE